MSKRLLAVSAISALGVATMLAPSSPASATTPKGVPIGIVKSLDVTNKGLLVYADSGGSHVKVKSWDPAHPTNAPVVLVGGLPAGSAQAATNDHKDIWVVYGGGDPDAPPSAGEFASAWYIPYKGTPRRVLDVAKFQKTKSPDPYDLEGLPGDSNPYDVEVLPDGSALIADAAGNDLIRVTKSGQAWTVACFPDQLETTKNVPPDPSSPPLPPMIPAEAVPTGVALDGHGNAYVSTLTGFPFALRHRPGVPGRRRRQERRLQRQPGTPGQARSHRRLRLHRDQRCLGGARWCAVHHRARQVRDLQPGERDQPGVDPRYRPGDPGEGHHPQGDRPGTLTAPGAAVLARDGHVYVTDLSLIGAVLTKIS